MSASLGSLDSAFRLRSVLLHGAPKVFPNIPITVSRTLYYFLYPLCDGLNGVRPPPPTLPTPKLYAEVLTFSSCKCNLIGK